MENNPCLLNITSPEYTGFHTPEGRTITISEIIGSEQALYMKYILLSSIILFGYVIYANFIMDTKYDFLEKYNIDVHELAILPSVILLAITLAYEGVI